MELGCVKRWRFPHVSANITVVICRMSEFQGYQRVLVGLAESDVWEGHSDCSGDITAVRTNKGIFPVVVKR
jgi:hypothetical protein